jgi:hypothetical protein
MLWPRKRENRAWNFTSGAKDEIIRPRLTELLHHPTSRRLTQNHQWKPKLLLKKILLKRLQWKKLVLHHHHLHRPSHEQKIFMENVVFRNKIASILEPPYEGSGDIDRENSSMRLMVCSDRKYLSS